MKCSKCGIENDYAGAYCEQCTIEYNRAYYKKNREEIIKEDLNSLNSLNKCEVEKDV